MRSLALSVILCFLLIVPAIAMAAPSDPGQLLLETVRFCDGNSLYTNITEADVVTRYDFGVCPHGCNPYSGRLGAACNNSPYLLPLPFYLIILGATSACLVSGVVYQRWLLCMASVVFFLYLAFQSAMIQIGNSQFLIMPLVVLCWFLAIVATGFTLMGLKASYDARNDEDNKKPSALDPK